ncbi:putative transcriptional regulatory, AraC family protein [Kaistia sp. 32K]|uniref:AraC family transcriptional regulator n=1 Tax=Kaistia sp. 32K TaxID=2795690 RepID=UPI001916A56A|nr:AraC family transcriptional regulator [Kaistia sp. 32K]BCP51720.1 putative transcriptional regulatory, AraC family protein [Kaistia sp. 32K]
MANSEPNGECAWTTASDDVGARSGAARRRSEGEAAGPQILVRLGMATAIPRLLRESGLDPAAVLAGAGLDLPLFDDPDALVPLRALDALLGLCLEATQCEHFGLLMGRACGPSALGAVGCLTLHSPTVGAALDSLVRHFRHHGQGAELHLGLRSDVAMLGFQLPLAAHADQIADGAVAVACNLLRALCGPGWQPVEVLLQRRVPSELGPFRQHLGPNLRFNQEAPTIVFSAHWLRSPVEGADPVMRRILEHRIAEMEAEAPVSLSDSLRGYLRSMLLKENCSIEAAARRLELHPRALRRRLAEERTTYSALVDEVRFEIARQLLSLTSLTAGEISSALDFCDGAAFTRAFKRWSGWTPSAWRSHAAAAPGR